MFTDSLEVFLLFEEIDDSDKECLRHETVASVITHSLKHLLLLCVSSLQAYSVYDEEIGYCQGQSFLAAVLLLHVSITHLSHLHFSAPRPGTIGLCQTVPDTVWSRR